MSGEGNGQDQGRGEISPEDREAIRQRSLDIGRKLDAVKARTTPARDEDERRRGAAYGQAFRYAADLVVGVGVGAFIGWSLDKYLCSAPWLMALFVILGFAAGLLNIIRAAQKAQAEMEPLQRGAPAVSDDDDDEKDN